jgi:hypothetical protein
MIFAADKTTEAAASAATNMDVTHYYEYYDNIIVRINNRP